MVDRLGTPAQWASLPVHPFLLAVYFVLALDAANGSELIRLTDLIGPTSISLAVAAVSWILASWATGGVRAGALVAAATVTAFATFGAMLAGAGQPLWAIGGPFGLLLVLVYGLLVFTWALRRARRAYVSVTSYVNLVAVLLLAYTVIRVARDASLSSAFAHSLQDTNAEQRPPKHVLGGSHPDIYFIILDKYTASRMLAAHYGFDNSPFENSLRRRGFVVPGAGQANYVHTSLALAAMLNLEYLDWVPQKVGPDNQSWEPLYPFIERNRFAEYLQNEGYRYIFFPSAFAATRQSRIADVELPRPSQIRPEFASVWLWTTPIPVVHLFGCHLLGCEVTLDAYTPESADLLDWKFLRLGELGDSSRPAFAFVHLTLPHEPYIYDGQCNHRQPYWPLDDRTDTLAVKTAYIAQIQCLNQKLLHLVDRVRARSQTPPVIVLQADHGHGRLGRLPPGLDQLQPWQVDERRAIFAAYLLPGVPAGAVSDSISPINITRLLLQHYFGAEYPQLPNVTYWSSWTRPYRFTRLP